MKQHKFYTVIRTLRGARLPKVKDRVLFVCSWKWLACAVAVLTLADFVEHDYRDSEYVVEEVL